MKLLIPDSSCLIALQNVDRIHLLDALADQILVPNAVVAECGELPKWIKIRESNTAIAEQFRKGPPRLDLGESEALALGKVTAKSTVVVDELRARRAAKGAGIDFIGTVAILIAAKRSKMIENVQDEVSKLRSVGFRVSDALFAHALRLAGEAE